MGCPSRPKHLAEAPCEFCCLGGRCCQMSTRAHMLPSESHWQNVPSLDAIIQAAGWGESAKDSASVGACPTDTSLTSLAQACVTRGATATRPCDPVLHVHLPGYGSWDWTVRSAESSAPLCICCSLTACVDCTRFLPWCAITLLTMRFHLGS